MRHEDEPELADLHLVPAEQLGFLDPVAVDVGAVQAADVADGEPGPRSGRTPRGGGTRSRHRGRCGCRDAARRWSARCRAGTGCPRSGPGAPPAAPYRRAAPPASPDRRAARRSARRRGPGPGPGRSSRSFRPPARPLPASGQSRSSSRSVRHPDSDDRTVCSRRWPSLRQASPLWASPTPPEPRRGPVPAPATQARGMRLTRLPGRGCSGPCATRAAAASPCAAPGRCCRRMPRPGTAPGPRRDVCATPPLHLRHTPPGRSPPARDSPPGHEKPRGVTVSHSVRNCLTANGLHDMAYLVSPPP